MIPFVIIGISPTVTDPRFAFVIRIPPAVIWIALVIVTFSPALVRISVVIVCVTSTIFRVPVFVVWFPAIVIWFTVRRSRIKFVPTYR